MSKIADIEVYLNNCSTGVASGCATGTGLIAVHKRVFKHKRKVTKTEIVKELSRFYADEKNIITIWNTMNVCERDFITYFIQYNCNEYLPTTLEYAKKHNIALEYETSYGYQRNILDYYGYLHLKFLHLITKHNPKTKTPLLFPNGKEIPPFILTVLQTVVEPIKCEYKEYTPATTDYIICRENRLGDFAAVVHFTNSEKLKVKTETFDITKAKLVKLVGTIGFEEVCDQNGTFCTPKNAKRNNNFKVAPLLFTLAANSKLLDIDKEGNVFPGTQSTTLLTMPPHKLAKKLFDDYTKNNNIYELRYIPHITAYGGERWIKWHECRKTIVEMLKNCPTEIFIKFEDFNKYAKIFYGNFFRRLLNYAITIRGYNFGYGHLGNDNANWNEYEAQFIMIILSFLSTIGMIDIAYTQNVPRITYSDDNFCIGIAGFRITKLGAWILGMTDKYEAPTNVITRNTKGELLILPDYTIVISGLKCRIEHETFLSQFFTKISSDENAAVYKLDFKSITRAYSNRITPTKIKNYLKSASNKNLPDNVERTLTGWQTKVDRIKIRELTVLETDDQLLLEEIKHIKAMDNIIIGDLHNAIILANDSKKKAKTLIEKNGWLVKI